MSALRRRLHHLRETHGRQEIDILGDLGRGIIGIEVKATAAPSTATSWLGPSRQLNRTTTPRGAPVCIFTGSTRTLQVGTTRTCSGAGRTPWQATRHGRSVGTRETVGLLQVEHVQEAALQRDDLRLGGRRGALPQRLQHIGHFWMGRDRQGPARSDAEI